jgi:hypothetical protein
MMHEHERQQTAIVLECEEAEQELARLEESARTLAENIRQVADWIESSTSPDFLRKMEVQERHAKISSEDGSKHYAQALDIQRAMETVKLVIAARKKVDDLRQRKNSHGLR